jgi:PAS domain S-box-containing protein
MAPPVPSGADPLRAGQLKLLFDQDLDGVFFCALDEPLRWDDAADKEALLDYAFDHLRVTAANDALCRQHGTTREALLGSTPRSRGEGRDEWRVRIRRLYDAGQQRHACQARQADGTACIVEGSYVCTYDADRRLTGHFGIQRDVTERVATDQRLRASEARLAAAQAIGKVGDFTFDVATQATEWSPQLFRIHGIPVTAEPPPLARFLELLHPDDHARWHDMVSRPDEAPSHALFRAIRPDGQVRQLSMRAVVERDLGGRAARVVGTVQDVTDLQAALEVAARREAEFQRSEERLDLALEGGQLAVIDWDPRGDQSYVDPRLAAMLGYTVDELLAHDGGLVGLVHPADLAELQAHLDRHLAGESADYRHESRLRHRSGEWRWVLATGRVVERDADGRASRIVGVAQDVTERHQIEQRLRLAERMASVGTLAAGVAHELNNPLAFVLGNLEQLAGRLERAAGGLPSDAVAALVATAADAVRGAERVRDIVRDLRTFARGDDAAAGPVDLGPVLSLAVQMTANQIRHRARLVEDLAPVPPVRGNPSRLGQVFVNLLVNAAQAIPEGEAGQHEIRLATRRDGGRVIVEVADSGRGMAPDVIGRIFDPFYTTKPVGEGTGLGLSICHTLVAEAGGEIRVDSAPGRGSRFLVFLPVAAPGPAAIPASPGPPEAAVPSAVAASPCRILVVDDEPLAGAMFVRLLEGHEVVTETRAADALARIAGGERFDRIFCDLMMPVMSGPELYRRLPAGVRDRVVFMTGGAFTRQAADFLDAVPNPRLHKPFELEALEAVLGFRLP